MGAGFEEFRWTLPVRPGDTLRLESEVLEVRPSKSRPEQGLIKVRTTTLNQNGEAVQVTELRENALGRAVRVGLDRHRADAAAELELGRHAHGEHQRLARLGQQLQHLAKIRGQAERHHAIGFVEHQDLHVLEVEEPGLARDHGADRLGKPPIGWAEGPVGPVAGLLAQEDTFLGPHRVAAQVPARPFGRRGVAHGVALRGMPDPPSP